MIGNVTTVTNLHWSPLRAVHASEDSSLELSDARVVLVGKREVLDWLFINALTWHLQIPCYFVARGMARSGRGK